MTDGTVTGTVPDQTRILIVDDSVRNLTALEATLCDLEVSIDRATSGEDALRRLLVCEYAVILLDVQMPGINGFETASIIRERDRSQHTPIIFLTAHDSDHTHAFAGYAVGAVDYISKPYDPEILKAKVATFVELYRKRDEVRRQSELLAEINQEFENRNHRIESLNRQISAMNEDLEQRVLQRTQELEEINRKLKEEIAERQRVEQEVRRLNVELEERVRDRTADLEAFSYSLSHDLRAPLRSIDGFSAALNDELEGSLSDIAVDYLQRIRMSCTRMQALIDDMLMLAKATHVEMRVRDIDISAMATEIAEELRTVYPEHHVRFTVQPEIHGKADRGLLRIALYNLLDNAWKFSVREEHPAVEIGTIDRDGTTCIFVRDNGTGFDVEEAQDLFTPFQRFHSAHDFAGTGIGLTIVHRVVTRHGGAIEVVSREGAGTTVQFTLERA